MTGGYVLLQANHSAQQPAPNNSNLPPLNSRADANVPELHPELALTELHTEASSLLSSQSRIAPANEKFAYGANLSSTRRDNDTGVISNGDKKRRRKRGGKELRQTD